MKQALLVTTMLLIFGAKIAKAVDESYKFGYVNFQKVLHEVEDGKKAMSMLESEYGEKQKKINVMKTKLETMKTDLDKQRLILSSDAMKDKEEEYRKKYIEFQQTAAGYEQEMEMKNAKLSSEIFAVASTIIKNIGEKDAYTTILESSKGALLYSKDSLDLTDRVIKEYNSMPKDKKDSILKSLGVKK